MMTSTHPAPESFVNNSFQSQSAQRFFSLYFKPIVLATATALVLAFLVAYSCLSLAAGVSTTGHKDAQQNVANTELSNKTAMQATTASTAN